MAALIAHYGNKASDIFSEDKIEVHETACLFKCGRIRTDTIQ